MFNDAYISAVLATPGDFMVHYLFGLTTLPGEFNTIGVISWTHDKHGSND